MCENVFPCGKPKTIIHPHDIAKVALSENGAFFDGKKIEGLIHARVLVKDNFYPFLQYRAHGKSYCALCRKCVETESTIPCQCKDSEKRYICFLNSS